MWDACNNLLTHTNKGKLLSQKLFYDLYRLGPILKWTTTQKHKTPAKIFTI